MSKSPSALALAALVAAALAAFGAVELAAAPKSKPGAKPAAAPALSKPLGIGREAKPEEIAGWDIDVRPDGKGLPRRQRARSSRASRSTWSVAPPVTANSAKAPGAGRS